MTNQIFLSATSVRKYLERFQLEQTIELPIIGKAVISAKEITFRHDQLCMPIHHEMSFVPDFEIVLEKFKCEANGISFDIGRVGVIPGFGVELLSQALANILTQKLGKSGVHLEGNRITLDGAHLLPKELEDIRLTRLQVLAGNEAGVRIEFEF